MEPLRKKPVQMTRNLVRELLERKLLVFPLFFLVVLLVLFLLFPVVFGEEGEEGIPVLLMVVPGVFQELVQLGKVRHAQVEALKQHQAGKQYGRQP